MDGIAKTLKRLLLRASYEAGVPTLLAGHLAGPRTVAVLGLHRVLDKDDPRLRYAMPHWTLTKPEFSDLLRVLSRWFDFLSLDDLRAMQARTRRDHRPGLLLTFDDGWADTADTALPVLRALGIPAVVFVVSGSLDSQRSFWDTEWHAALVAASDEQRAHVRHALGIGDTEPPDLQSTIAACLRRLRERELPERWTALDALLGGPIDHGGPLMLRRDQLGPLLAGGIEVGAHGVSHEPLLRLPNGAAEIPASISALNDALRHTQHEVRSFSFPHGSYSSRLVETCRAEGAQFVFTSDAVRNRLAGAEPPTALGRFWPVASEHFAKGRLDAARLTWEIARSRVVGL